MNLSRRINLNAVRKKLNHTFLVQQRQAGIPDILEGQHANTTRTAGKSRIHPFRLDNDIGVKGLIRIGDFMKMVNANPAIDLFKLAALCGRVYPGGAAEVLDLVRRIRTGEPLTL